MLFWVVNCGGETFYNIESFVVQVILYLFHSQIWFQHRNLHRSTKTTSIFLSMFHFKCKFTLRIIVSGINWMRIHLFGLYKAENSVHKQSYNRAYFTTTMKTITSDNVSNRVQHTASANSTYQRWLKRVRVDWVANRMNEIKPSKTNNQPRITFNVRNWMEWNERNARIKHIFNGSMHGVKNEWKTKYNITECECFFFLICFYSLLDQIKSIPTIGQMLNICHFRELEFFSPRHETTNKESTCKQWKKKMAASDERFIWKGSNLRIWHWRK